MSSPAAAAKKPNNIYGLDPRNSFPSLRYFAMIEGGRERAPIKLGYYALISLPPPRSVRERDRGGCKVTPILSSPLKEEAPATITHYAEKEGGREENFLSSLFDFTFTRGEGRRRGDPYNAGRRRRRTMQTSSFLGVIKKSPWGYLPRLLFPPLFAFVRKALYLLRGGAQNAILLGFMRL